ncbi:MAG: SoxR reducing system RseC family protein [Desulfuromonadaceae bacterium]|jgi:sigma-E factor negative regulatory protein RseC
MIEESGTIIELKNQRIALVVCQKSAQCKHCAAAGLCSIGDDGSSMRIEAHNDLGAKIGDQVRLMTSTRKFLQSSFILYIVPILALVAGAVAGDLLGSRFNVGMDPNLFTALTGTAALVISMFLIRLASRRLSKEDYMPRIVEILEKEE